MGYQRRTNIIPKYKVKIKQQVSMQYWNKEFKISMHQVAAEVKQIKLETKGLIHNQSRQRGDEVVD